MNKLMDKPKQKFTLVIPTYNEAANIEALYSLLVEVLFKNNIDFEVIIVDDNSPDQTWKIVQLIAEKDKRIRVIRRVNEKGLATAVIAGWKSARGDILGVMDGDLQQPPETLPLLLNKLNEDALNDVVIASRNIKGAITSRRSVWRRFVSWSGAFISALLLPRLIAQVSDPMSGFFIVRKSVIENKILTPWGYKILLEVLAKGTYKKISEVPYIFVERKRGGSKAGIKQYLISFIYLLRLNIQSKKAG
ncbi:MAG: polyprenol monophosphomannose synthase [Candidatus Omnitrophica bacterium]|nr:polyprenol monophosphomannose synthase [Candidatus Omnitrophota bacterium]MBU1923896.1 polyprenol monophosphomannose synthase [Candidatus Omnitrophota bacterium]